MLDALTECGYLARERSFEPSFYVATDSEWKERYRGWLRDPVMQQTHRARTLFDLRPVLGRRSPWQDVEAAVTAAVDRDVLHVLANDCLTTLPPLTFYQDAVVDHVGEHDSIFRLEERALRPLVDVGRVFGMAGGAVFARSTLERLETARTLLPAHERIFREAADAFRVVLWQQGRVGLMQRTTGAELPPALLSRNDRHVLKRGFRSILELIEFTAEPDMAREPVDASVPARYRSRFDTTWSDDDPIDRVRFVILDSETTGLNPAVDRIVTIGAVAVLGGDIVLEDSFAALLQIERNTAAVMVHGITRTRASHGVTEAQAIAGFLDYLRDGVIVGHHIGHDIATLDAACERHWGFTLLNRSLDTMDLTLHLERDGAFAGRPPVRRFTLDALCTMFGVIPHDRHTASGDAFITAQVFLRLLRLASRFNRGSLIRLTEPFEVEASA